MIPATGPRRPAEADKPAEDVGVGRGEQLPRAHCEAKKAGDEATGTEADEPRIEVGKIIRWRDDIGANVDVERGDENGDHCYEGYERLMESSNHKEDVRAWW